MENATKKTVCARKLAHQESVDQNAVKSAKNYPELVRATRQHVWWNASLDLKTQYVHQVCELYFILIVMGIIE